MALMGFGTLLVMAASPAVADRIGADNLHFVKRFFAVLPLAISALFVASMQSPRGVRRLAVIGFLIALALLALTFVIGVDIKGARRWINLGGFALQPSEFVKPTFAVVAAWLFAEQRANPSFPGNAISLGLFILVLAMLVKQPDLGMAAVVSSVLR